MSGSKTDFVRCGLYTDYGRHSLAQKQWLWDSFRATLWTNFLAILVTIALARLFRILQRVHFHIAENNKGIGAGTTGNVLPSQPIGLPRLPQTASHASSSTANSFPTGSQIQDRLFQDLSIVREQTTPDSKGWHQILDALKRIFAGPPHLPGAGQLNPSSKVARSPLSRLYWWELWEHMEIKSNLPQLIGGLLYLLAYLGVLACGVLTAQLATDSTAISASPDCGLYLPDSSLNAETAARISRPYEFDAQVESATLAQSCYKTPAATDNCNFFTHRSIDFSIQRNAPCPFEDGLCHGGPQSAISFSTGPINARVIGINAPKTYEFRRNSNCSPLNMNETFIRQSKDDGGRVHHYYYGSATPLAGPETDWCYRTRDAAYMPDAPGYLVNGLFIDSRINWNQNEWDPIPELRPPPGSSLSILFVNVQKTFYLSPRHDPIFPAETRHHIKGLDQTYYINSLGHATVMACVDRTEWRDPDYGDAWSSMDQLPALFPQDPRVYAGLWLMRYSLLNSNIFQSIELRLASTFDAQSRISSFVSLDMPENQWEIELERFFKISLARIQINARNIARGVPAKYEGWYKRANNDTICMDNYLFQTQGWTNVNYTVSLLVLVPCLMLLVLAIPSDEEKLWPEPVLRHLSQTPGGKASLNIIQAAKGYLISATSNACSIIFNEHTLRRVWQTSKRVIYSSPGLLRAARHGGGVGRKLEEISTVFFSGFAH